MKKIFVIGDIHGCLFTLNKLLESWDQASEQLIFIGDLIDRGNFSPEVVSLVKKLVKKEDAVCLMGNHEYACYHSLLNKKEATWFKEMGEFTIQQYIKGKQKIKKDAKWFSDLPLIWQNGEIIISHAGISEISTNPFDKSTRDSVLWTRSKLKTFKNKIQIHGHTPAIENPKLNKETNSWNIDSACVYSYFLTGIKLNIDGTFIETIKIKTDKRDVPRKYDLSE